MHVTCIIKIRDKLKMTVQLGQACAAHRQARELVDPELIAKRSGDEGTQRGVAESQPPTGCHTIGLVLKLVRPQVGKVLEDGLLDDLGMDGRDTVDGVRGNHGQVRHAHEPAGNHHLCSSVGPQVIGEQSCGGVIASGGTAPDGCRPVPDIALSADHALTTSASQPAQGM